MSLEGRLRELAAVAEAAAALIQAHRSETEEAIRELSERVARLEAAPSPGPVSRSRKEGA